MFVVTRILDGLTWAAGAAFLLLHRFLVGLLTGMRAFAAGLRTATHALWQHLLELAYFLGQILIALGQVAILLTPGGALVGLGLRQDSPWLWVPGAVYLVLCMLMGLAYRGAGDTGPLAGNVPPNWLAFFPFSWTRYEDLAPALASLLAARREVEDALRRCRGVGPLDEEVERIELGMHRYLRELRRELATRVERHVKLEGRSVRQSGVLTAAADEVSVVAERFRDIAKWTRHVAEHPAWSSDQAPGMRGATEEIEHHVEELRAFAGALDSLERENVFGVV